jgi:non-specific serine/threonine protein kinase
MSNKHKVPTDPRPATPAGHALPVGTRLEYFEIGRVISASNFGIVYAATDLTLQHPVAIKEYLPTSVATRGEQLDVVPRGPQHLEVFERGRDAFIEEARRLARCNHPSLLRILRLWEANGTVYRAMPNYEGSSLLTWRQAQKQPPTETWLRALIDVLLEAIETLQKAGLVHRRIAPANVMMQTDGLPVLMDFDAVRGALVSSQSQSLMAALDPASATGAPAPESPGETERGLGPDLHALAALVHFCISGNWPLSAQFDMQWREPLEEVVQRLRIASPSLRYSGGFLRAIDTLLSQAPHERTASIDEFRQMFISPPPAVTPSPVAAPEEPVAEAAAPSQQAPLVPGTPEPAPETPRPTGAVTPNPSVSVLNLLASFDQRGAADPAPAEAPAGMSPPVLTDRVPTPPPPSPATARASAPVPAFGESTFFQDREPAPSALRDSPMADVPWTERAVHASRASSRAVKPSWRRRLGIVGVVVLLVGAAVGAAWQINEMQKTDHALSRLTETNPVGDGGAAPPSAGTGATGTVMPVPRPLPAPAASIPASRPAAVSPQAPLAPAPATAPNPPADPDLSANNVPAPNSPREACGARTEFALYRCMQNQCSLMQWRRHPQCLNFRASEGLPE